MKRLLFLCLLVAITVVSASAQQRGPRIRKDVPLDSIRLSDPAILADQKTKMYYMTGIIPKMPVDILSAHPTCSRWI